MNCKNCNNDLFKIIVSDCKDCEYNGAWDGEEIIFDEEIIKNKNLERNEVYESGGCFLGESFGNGCYIFMCSKCGKIINMPLLEGE